MNISLNTVLKSEASKKKKSRNEKPLPLPCLHLPILL